MFLPNETAAKVSTFSNDPDKVNAQLRVITLWLEENPQINARKDTESLMFFLHSCKYDVDRTKKKLTNFYYMRAERTEWFAERDPFLPEIQELLKLGVFLPVDGCDEDGRKVIVIRTAAHNPKLHSQNNVFKVSKMILDLLLKFEPENCARGIVAIFDMSGVQLGHALQLTPTLIKRSVHSWTAYPCQPKLLEFINAPTHVNMVLNTFRMFMTAKMRSRVVVQKRSVKCSVKCENLPSDIGGKGVCYKDLSLKWQQLVEHNANFFADDEQFKSILST